MPVVQVQEAFIVVDTSNEIAGDGSVPHPCIGRARRMPVAKRQEQHKVLHEAVQNHNPEVRDCTRRSSICPVTGFNHRLY